MRLLLDQNLSFRLVEHLSDAFPETAHVRDVGLGSADDETIWEYARANDCVIVTKDGDFHQHSFLVGAPPKVLWLRLGNCTTSEIEAVLLSRAHEIKEFMGDALAALLVVDR